MLLNRLIFCLLCALASRAAFALGLGDLNGQPVLGERLHLEIKITGAGRESSDASCYGLKRPATGDDMPWVKTAALTVKKGAQPILEIRSNRVVVEPILAISVHIGCGIEVSRDYVLTASPESVREKQAFAPSPVVPVSFDKAPSPPAVSRVQAVAPSAKRAALPRANQSTTLDEEGFPVRSRERAAPRGQSGRKQLSGGAMSDRLMLFGLADVGDPALRLSVDLPSVGERSADVSEVQRDILRLEFKMLLALQEQALTQLEANAKIRNLDQALLELQKNVADRQKLEAAAQPSVAPSPVATSAPAAKVTPDASTQEEWPLYALLIGAFAGIAGWLGWKGYQERRARNAHSNHFVPAEPQQVMATPAVKPEVSPPATPMATAMPVSTVESVDLQLDEPSYASVEEIPPEMPFAPLPMGEGMESATVDERFEANPVMELADVMLSFGRVKGAAQALQEYIDANPQEALQPWMRLLNVYRMAGMRSEFEELALNLNKNFNVEIQHWDDKPAASAGEDQSIDFVLDDIKVDEVQPAKAQHIEDMPRIMQQIVERWGGADFSTFIYDLLRDNRGGARLGFSIGVVEEMLFLIELKETVTRLG